LAAKGFSVISKDHPRVEVEEKVTGEYEYVGDITLPNMLHAKILRSPYTHALIKMNEDGTANLSIAACDMGIGNITAMAAIAAEELGIRYEDVIVTEASTDTTLWEFWIHSSRSVYSVGVAVKRASANVREVVLDWAAKMLSIPAEQLETKDGLIYPKREMKKGVSFKEVLEYAQSQDWGTAVGTASGNSHSCPPHFVVTFVEVEVDTMTGEGKVLRAVHSADVGTPIIPSAVRGQLLGELHMGLGFALTEAVAHDSVDGHVLNTDFRDYKLLTPLDMPKVETFLADVWEPTGPFGAKGIGEGALNPVAPAVYNAVSNAIGVRIYDMPITPEKVLKALKNKPRD